MKLINQKGITLVSLVVTIIILLILAGVSIIAFFGQTGLLDLTSKSAEKYKDSQQKENKELGDLSNGVVKGDLPNYPDRVEGTEQGTIIKTPVKWTAGAARKVNTETGKEEEIKIASVYAVSDGKDNMIPVPYGFYYVGGTKETGVVISDNEADKNKYAKYTPEGEVKEGIPSGAIYKEDGSAKRIVYDNTGNIVLDEFTEEEKKTAILGNQFVWIPCEVENYKKNTDFEIRPSDYNWLDWDTPQSEKTQIEKYGGFYVGRYEAGTSNITLSNGEYFRKSIKFE